MAKGGGAVAGAFIGSIILSVVITGAAGYFLLPKFTAPTYVYEEFNSSAQLNDNNLAWLDVPDTELNISIKKNSRISCTFSGSYLIGASSTLGSNSIRFEILLGVETAGNTTVYVKYLDNGGVSAFLEIASSFSMDYTTGVLPKGTYRVYLAWRSLADASGGNYFLFRTPSMDYTRSLSAMEIYT